MPYVLHRENEKGQPESEMFNAGYEGILPTHYEVQGVHIIINRYQGPEVENLTLTRHATISFGDNSEKLFIKEHGEETNGIRHYLEHIIARLIDKVYANEPVKRLLDCLDILDMDGIKVTAGTSLQSIYLAIESPHDQDFARTTNTLNRVLNGELISKGKVVEGDVPITLADIEEAMGQEVGRIADEMKRSRAEDEINGFTTTYVLSEDSCDKAPRLIGKIENLEKAVPEIIAEWITEITTNSSAIVTIHNPPSNQTDKELIEQILGKNFQTRRNFTAESKSSANHWAHPGKWVHLEHEYIPNDGELEALMAIPIERFTEKDIATWHILAELLIMGSTSKKAKKFYYELKSHLYTAKITLNRARQDIQVEAKVDANKLLFFLQDVFEFWSSPDHQQHILGQHPKTSEPLFDIYKRRNILRAKNRYSDTQDLTDDLRYYGRYVPPTELLRKLEAVTLEEVLELLERIKNGISRVTMLTVGGISTPGEILQFIKDQQEAIKEILPLALQVQCINGADDVFANTASFTL